jgi:hypothetical protein
LPDLGGPSVGDGGAVGLPGGSSGIMFDDLRFSSRLDRMVSPARSTGNVDLVDPLSQAVVSIPGFGDAGSADEGGGFIFAVDRAANRLVVADPALRVVVASVAVASFPDYVRFVAPTMEAWVSEPTAMGVEIFSLSGTPPIPAHAGFVSTPHGPEGLAVDATHNRAYVHLDAGAIAAIDLTTRSVVATWPTGCNGSHGIPALDEQRGFVFAGCSESARVAVLDTAHGGAILDSYTLGGGETLLGYSTSLHHFYLRGDPGIPVATLAVAANGKLSLLGTVTTAMAGHCVTPDNHNAYWVCDAAAGRLLHFVDNFPATP